MLELIHKIHTILNLVKGFEAGYSSKTANKGKMVIQYGENRYFVKFVQIENAAEDMFADISKLEYFD